MWTRQGSSAHGALLHSLCNVLTVVGLCTTFLPESEAVTQWMMVQAWHDLQWDLQDKYIIFHGRQSF